MELVLRSFALPLELDESLTAYAIDRSASTSELVSFLLTKGLEEARLQDSVVSRLDTIDESLRQILRIVSAPLVPVLEETPEPPPEGWTYRPPVGSPDCGMLERVRDNVTECIAAPLGHLMAYRGGNPFDPPVDAVRWFLQEASAPKHPCLCGHGRHRKSGACVSCSCSVYRPDPSFHYAR